MKSSYDFSQMAGPQQQQQQHQQQHQQQQQQHHKQGGLQQQQQQLGRNLSAMLDENNTVISYLEPMAK